MSHAMSVCHPGYTSSCRDHQGWRGMARARPFSPLDGSTRRIPRQILSFAYSRTRSHLICWLSVLYQGVILELFCFTSTDRGPLPSYFSASSTAERASKQNDEKPKPSRAEQSTAPAHHPQQFMPNVRRTHRAACPCRAR